jgi:hypothetical protein
MISLNHHKNIMSNWSEEVEIDYFMDLPTYEEAAAQKQGKSTIAELQLARDILLHRGVNSSNVNEYNSISILLAELLSAKHPQPFPQTNSNNQIITKKEGISTATVVAIITTGALVGGAIGGACIVGSGAVITAPVVIPIIVAEVAIGGTIIEGIVIEGIIIGAGVGMAAGALGTFISSSIHTLTRRHSNTNII